MFCLHKATSAVSCVKPNASQWEARLCDDVRFLTVYRRIYHRRLFHWMELSPFKCICSFFLLKKCTICTKQQVLWAVSNQMPASEKRHVMTSDFRQYIAEYTIANFFRYPIRRPALVAQLDTHLTGDQEVARSTPSEVGNILLWRLMMKYFLRSFSPFCWFKKGRCQFLAKECSQYWLTA